MYDESVGRGTNLNLNLPPDRRGRLADIDVAVLTSFGTAQAATFARDLAQGAVATASHSRGAGFSPANVLDGRADSYWSTADGITTPSLTLDLPPGRAFDLVRLREYLPLGLRVTQFAVDAEVDGRWRELARHACIGAQRIIRLPAPVTARRLRLRILEAPACPAIREIALFRQVAPTAVATVVASDPSIVATTRWSIAAASAPGAQALLDNDTATSWALPAPKAGAPASVTIDLGATETLAGFSLTPSRAVMADTAPPRATGSRRAPTAPTGERPARRTAQHRLCARDSAHCVCGSGHRPSAPPQLCRDRDSCPSPRNRRDRRVPAAQRVTQ
ncbi:discoidin domain-containing protein [Sphingomonas aerolata]|uniref:discoidin domain-containing protein n=1 Tax=Sphingomonas aerolata TaxID=185951 RepID=UPI002FE3E778